MSERGPLFLLKSPSKSWPGDCQYETKAGQLIGLPLCHLQVTSGTNRDQIGPFVTRNTRREFGPSVRRFHRNLSREPRRGLRIRTMPSRLLQRSPRYSFSGALVARRACERHHHAVTHGRAGVVQMSRPVQPSSPAARSLIALHDRQHRWAPL